MKITTASTPPGRTAVCDLRYADDKETYRRFSGSPVAAHSRKCRHDQSGRLERHHRSRRNIRQHSARCLLDPAFQRRIVTIVRSQQPWHRSVQQVDLSNRHMFRSLPNNASYCANGFADPAAFIVALRSGQAPPPARALCSQRCRKIVDRCRAGSIHSVVVDHAERTPACTSPACWCQARRPLSQRATTVSPCPRR